MYQLSQATRGMNQFHEGNSTLYSADTTTIRIVEHPGYMETLDGVFEIEPGRYTFVVKNESNKNSGFVLSEEEGKPTVLTIKKGETGTLDIYLKSGNYTYYCPLIPTPIYPIQVK
jgi:hypothetical protein